MSPFTPLLAASEASFSSVSPVPGTDLPPSEAQAGCTLALLGLPAGVGGPAQAERPLEHLPGGWRDLHPAASARGERAGSAGRVLPR